jgi:AcrR family transcriptional regulator
MSDTKERILNAAEQMFAEYGFEGTSLRAITTKAGVNLAAVNYHFHSKEDLIRALFARVVEPINQQRLATLDALEKEAAGKPVPLRKLVEAFVAPVLQAKRGRGFPVLISRVYAEPGDVAVRLMKEQMMETGMRFADAFGRAVPHLPTVELGWRIFFLIGAMSHIIGGRRLLALFMNGMCDMNDTEAITRRLVDAGVALFRAPLSCGKRLSGRSE